MAVVNPQLGAARRAPWPALVLAAGCVLVGAAAIGIARGAQPLHRSWSSARAAGSYAFQGTTRVRTAAGVERWVVSGRGEVAGPITVALRGAAQVPGVQPSPAPSTTWQIRWPDVVDGDGRSIGRRAIGRILPAGDPLALLAAGHGARRGALEAVGGRACRRIDFLVGARAYGTWWSANRDVLPINGEAGGLWTFQAAATVWVDPRTDRPCRIAAQIQLPRLGDDRPGTGEVDWTYAWAVDAEGTASGR